MKLWAVESGTLWLSEAASFQPGDSAAPAHAVLGEVTPNDWPALQHAMNLPDPEPIRRRLQTGRRCFCLKVEEQIAAYGWATRGPENVGELERDFCLGDDEVYIWDCFTLPDWRGQGFYTTLLRGMRQQFHQEGVPRIWIGASRQNQPSIKGMVNAGFEHVMDVTYRRLGLVTLLVFTEAPSASRSQLGAAYRVLMTRHERRWGRVALGLYRGAN